jgi:hypothetical protein
MNVKNKKGWFNMSVGTNHYSSFGFDELPLERQQMVVEMLTARYFINKNK